jgi:hypothetical protein
MADMQHRVLSSPFDDEYIPYANAMADIANTAVSDQYLIPGQRHTGLKNKSERLTMQIPKAGA